MSAVADDERASARLLFAPELAAGTVRESLLARREVRDATMFRRVPAALSRAYQASLVRRGRLTLAGESVPRALTARERVLGDAAAGPPRLLVRCGTFPGPPEARRARTALLEARVPFLVAVDAEPLDGAAREELADLRRAGVAFGARVAVDSFKDVAERLDAAVAALAGEAVRPDVLVPAGGRIAWRAWPEIAKRFSVVCGGPESVRSLGWHDVPGFRAGTVWLPALAPFASRADDAATGARELAQRGAALWVAVALDPHEDVAKFVREAGPWCVVWEDFDAAVRLARRSSTVGPT